jgi:hypothetical protein
MLLTLASLLVLSPVPQGPSTAPVVINEFSYDDASTDTHEFVEIYNRSGAVVDISGWTLTGEEGSSGSPANGSFTFPGAPGSATTVIAPGQYIVVGQASVPLVNFVITGTSGLLLENTDSDGVTLRDHLGNVIDAVVWNYARWTNPAPAWLEGTGLWGGFIWQETAATDGQLTPQRWMDGYDSNNNGADFILMRPTPGAMNGTSNTLPLSFVANFDGTVGTVEPGISYSFVGPTIFDPSAVTIATSTVRSYPPSPQGGNLGRVQDPTGGGNALFPNVIVGQDFMAEVYVYVTAGNPIFASPGQGEAWAFGVRGTTGSYGTPMDIPGTYYAQASLCTGATNLASGHTGLAWMAFTSTGQTDIYLVDMNDGGPGWTVLGGPIVATPGVNDGWQRLRLRVSGSTFVANYGGTFGRDDGTRYTGTVTPNWGTVYFAYRECVSVNANLNGLYLDRLEIWGAVNSNVTFLGTGSPTFVGTPVIGTSGAPQVGSASFQINASTVIPFGVSLLALDAGPALPGIPVPGTQPGLLLYANPTVINTVLNDGLGNASFTLPIAPSNALAGALLAAQYFDLDVTLPYALPFGSSGGAQILVGN